MKQYIVDAFTDKPFSGNPVAVCVIDSWPSEDFMMKLAMENNLSETAFICKATSQSLIGMHAFQGDYGDRRQREALL